MKGRSAPEMLRSARAATGRSSTSVIGADGSQPLALRWIATDFPGIGRAHLEIFEPTTGAELVDLLGDLTMPVSNLIWADRAGSIGYKAVGRIPTRPGGCPDLPKPGWVSRLRVGRRGPLRRDARGDRSRRRLPGDGQQPHRGDDFPHHLSSDYLDGFRAKRIEQLIGENAEHDLESFRRMQNDLYSIPGDEVARRLAALPGPRRPARGRRDRAAEELGPPARARHDRRDDLPGLPAAPRTGLRQGGDRRPRPGRALARPLRQRVHHPRHLAVAVARPPALPLGGGRRGADRPPVGRARRRRAARRARRPDGPVRPRPRGVALGPRPRAALPARPRRRQPGLRVGLQPLAAPRRGTGDRRPDRLRPQRPLPRDLGPELADGRRPGRPRALDVAGLHRPVGPRLERALRRPPAALDGGPDAADGGRRALGDADAHSPEPA